jgi:hypothetical protein
MLLERRNPFVGAFIIHACIVKKFHIYIHPQYVYLPEPYQIARFHFEVTLF